MSSIARTKSQRGTTDEERPVSANYHANALARGLSLLEQLATASEPLTLSTLSDHTGLPKSTLIRLLSVLAELEYVVRLDDQPSFRLGHKVQHLARGYERALDVRALASQEMKRLAESTGHTANLGVLDGPQVVHVCVEESGRPLRFTSAVGSRDELYCTGLGKVLLSGLAADELPGRLPVEPYATFTDKTITSLTELSADLRKVRRRGYGVDDNERSVGLRCLAVPLELDGRTVAALSVSGPAAEFGAAAQRDYYQQVAAAAQRLLESPDFVTAIGQLTATLDRRP